MVDLGSGCVTVAERDAAIAAALDTVHDPCSVAAGRPTSVRAMGLVLGWVCDGPRLTVTFAVTFPGCTMAPHFTEAARAALLAIDGIDHVETLIDTAHVWQPEDMAPAPAMTGTPQAWRARVSADVSADRVRRTRPTSQARHTCASTP